MSNFINIRLPEAEIIKFRRWTNQQSEETKAKCKNRVRIAGERMMYLSKMRSAVDKGFLRRGLHVQYTQEGLGLNFYNAVGYAPYKEWGTGRFVSVPAGLEETAIQYKGKGIRNVNIYPKPFFYGSWEKAYKLFIKDLNDLGFHERSK